VGLTTGRHPASLANSPPVAHASEVRALRSARPHRQYAELSPALPVPIGVSVEIGRPILYIYTSLFSVKEENRLLYIFRIKWGHHTIFRAFLANRMSTASAGVSGACQTGPTRLKNRALPQNVWVVCEPGVRGRRGCAAGFSEACLRCPMVPGAARRDLADLLRHRTPEKCLQNPGGSGGLAPRGVVQVLLAFGNRSRAARPVHGPSPAEGGSRPGPLALARGPRPPPSVLQHA